jgi:hypothetical protein
MFLTGRLFWPVLLLMILLMELVIKIMLIHFWLVYEKDLLLMKVKGSLSISY